MENLITINKYQFILGFPLLMFLMLFLSALIGIKFQGKWLDSTINKYLRQCPKFLRLLLSAILGAVTPFCSCTTVPGFILILEGELGIDVAMTFLIASPTIDPAGTSLLFLLLGPKLTLTYLIGTFIISIVGGWLLGRIFTIREINPAILLNNFDFEVNLSWKEASCQAWKYVIKFWWVVLLSSVLGFIIYDFIPVKFIYTLSNLTPIITIPMAALLGILIYSHMAILIPLGATLLAKGLSPGIILAFLASGAGISPPEIILLRKIISLRLLIAYITITITMISIMGWIASWVGR